MGDKSPKKPQAKKPGQTLKEKRAAKKAKHDGASSSIVTNRSPRS